MQLAAIEACLADALIRPLSELQRQKTVQTLSALKYANEDSLSFVVGKKYIRELVNTNARAVLVTEQLSGSVPDHSVPLVVADPYLAFAKLSPLFADPLRRAASAQGIHPSASVASSARLGVKVSIGPGVVVEDGVQIGDCCIIGAGSFLGRDVSVGENSWLAPRVTLYFGCSVGKRAIIHSGAVIGADGFGFAKSSVGWVKIEQIGSVRIGDDVEIGANTTIDRGALGDTEIGHGCKLDNQIQIGHNVKIGEHTAMAACVGVAGSAIIGKRCMLGGSAGVLGHLSICDDVTISAMSLVASSIDKPGFYSGIYPLTENAQWEKSAVLVKQLPLLRQRIKALESAVSPSANSSTLFSTINPANP